MCVDAHLVRSCLRIVFTLKISGGQQMDRDYETAGANGICIFAGLACWALLIAAPLQMAGVI